MKIEIITGSPRKESTTKRVALHLVNYLKKNTAHEVNLLDVRDWDLPPLQSVFKSVDTSPGPFRELSKRMFEADAFILVTPEYNGSYTAALKNLLDHFPKQHQKPFGLATASTGALGGMRAAQQLLLLVPALFGIACPYLLAVPKVEQKFSETGELLDESFENSLHNFTAEFLWLAEKIVNGK